MSRKNTLDGNDWNSLTTVKVFGLGDAPTGIDWIHHCSGSELTLYVFPNPVAKQTTIQISNQWPDAALQLSVYNLNGQEIRKLVRGVA